MSEALILGAGRSPFGARHGQLARHHPAELLGAILDGALRRSGTEPSEVQELLVGCATPVGAQGGNLAAGAARAAGQLRHVPTSVVSTRDTSSLVALLQAADAVRSGRCGVVLVGGVELMSTVPAGADLVQRGFGRPLPPIGREAMAAPGVAAERWAERHDVGRDRLEEVARRSRRRARKAQDDGQLLAELLPVGAGTVKSAQTVSHDELLPESAGRAEGADAEGADEGVKAEDSAEGPRVEGLYSHDGLLTAATVAPMADGAAAAVVASPAAARRLGVEPVARIVAAALLGGDPTVGCGSAPEAVQQVLGLAGVSAGEVRRLEVGELFATSLVAWELNCSEFSAVLNLDGGSLALGHPQGATGLALVARLVRALGALPGGGYGLAACDSIDGHGVAVMLEV